jgi:hypothetical protein
MNIRSRILAVFIGGLVSASSLAQAAQGFEMSNVVLYQPDDVLRSRLGGDVPSLVDYISRVNTAAAGEFSQHTDAPGTSGAIVVAVKPNGSSRVWLELGENKLPEGLAIRLKSQLERLSPMKVHAGPVAFAIIFQAWGGGTPITTPEQPAPFPVEWREAVVGPEPGVVPDTILEAIWP